MHNDSQGPTYVSFTVRKKNEGPPDSTTFYTTRSPNLHKQNDSQGPTYVSFTARKKWRSSWLNNIL